MARARKALIVAAGHRFLDAWSEQAVPDGMPWLDPRDPRAAGLRGSPLMQFMLQRDRISQYWCRDLRHHALLSDILRRSAWARGSALPVAIATLSQASGLSAQSVGVVLLRARESGDLIGAPAPQDRRRLVLEPSPAMQAHVELMLAARLPTLLALTGGALPGPPGPLALWHWRRLRLGLDVLAASNRQRDARFARRVFLFSLWDIIQQPGRLRGPFTAAIARELGVTDQTVRNELHWLRQRGWLEAGERLVPTAEALHRAGVALGLLQARCGAMLEVLDCLVQMPALGDRLEVPGLPE